ncbi:voltage-gated potassium channel [Pontibacter aydingkolensis]|uniref:Ion transporter n=1 Tax=Pontibacter aydingkolensis TaxID=1911536 RepID=A0ABS7CTQ9_9BACT|nr:ion transporter [Pontibacter aydingkolensis]MBW7467241.1 ion transporter [Pontibacter aydingkolensis]
MTQAKKHSLRKKIYTIIFEAETPVGKFFDIALLILILSSVTVVTLESVVELRKNYLSVFLTLEWIFTIIFTIEYFLRIYSSPKPFKYIFSFFGLVDLLSIIPTYLSLFILGSQYFLVIRVLRLLRVARIFKLTRFINEGQVLSKALRASMAKILVFLGVVLTIVVIVGSMMYIIEGAKSGFTSIPISIYWTIVTLTTVGYGDIAPQSALGQVLASFIMIMGYGIIAVPTGIVSVELAKTEREALATTKVCPNCHKEGHFNDANYCFNCGYSFSNFQ